MKQKIVLFIITIAMVVSCMAVGAMAGTTDDQWGDIIENPWAYLFQDSTGNPSDIPWGFDSDVTTKASDANVKAPGKAVIKKIYKKKYAAKKIKMIVKKDKLAEGYQVAVFKSKKNAKKLAKPIYVKTVKKTKFTLKSKEFKKKKKLFVRVRAYRYPKIGAWSKIKKVKIKK